jgi:hypothetical protein
MLRSLPVLPDFLDRSNPKMEEQSIGYGILQIIRRWKALNEENILEQLIFSLVSCESLALEMKLARPKHGESDPTLENFN